MKVSSFITLLFLSFTLQAAEVVKSRNIDRGANFTELKTTEKRSDASDETSKHRYLYHKNRKLGEVKQYSISPSGSYAAYVEKNSGGLYLYSSSDGLLTPLTKNLGAPIKKFSWNETFEVLEISFSDDTPAKNFALE